MIVTCVITSYLLNKTTIITASFSDIYQHLHKNCSFKISSFTSMMYYQDLLPVTAYCGD